jgi:hypothetical protein
VNAGACRVRSCSAARAITAADRRDWAWARCAARRCEMSSPSSRSRKPFSRSRARRTLAPTVPHVRQRAAGSCRAHACRLQHAGVARGGQRMQQRYAEGGAHCSSARSSRLCSDFTSGDVISPFLLEAAPMLSSWLHALSPGPSPAQRSTRARQPARAACGCARTQTASTRRGTCVKETLLLDRRERRHLRLL